MLRRMNDDPMLSPIAIDGGAASGKSTLARALADRFRYRVLDTGAMYRAFTLAALEQRVPASDTIRCSELAAALDMQLQNGSDTHVLLAGTDVTPRLREPEVETNVSAYSAIAGVRTVMVERQRTFASAAPSILVGRDIGTVVLPGAPLKVYLTADDEARSLRRSKQTAEWGAIRSAEESSVDIALRDTTDTGREAAPLRPAADAIIIDTTAEDARTIAERVIRLILDRQAGERAR